MRRGAGRRVRAAWSTVAVAALLTAGTVPAAGASTAAEARREAAGAGAEVEALAAQLAQHLAAEEAALVGIAAGVQASVAADAASAEVASDAADARSRQTRTVRALYASGGELAVFVSMLSSSSLEDLAERQQMAHRVLRSAAETSQDAADALDRATAHAQAADAEAVSGIGTAADVVEAAAAVDATLARARARLAELSAEASRLEEAEEARRRWEEAERAATAARAAAASVAARRVTAVGIPADYQALYQQAAATCPGLRWTLLAAVGQVESRHGQNNGPSSAGAVGPMQFMPRTFAAFGVDGDGDGTADPWSPSDAIYSAARYLCHNGGGGTADADRKALLRYNNAQWYVDLVLGVERDLVARGASS